jgi:hypothetical protein
MNEDVPRSRLIDLLVVTLAVVSVGLVVYSVFGQLDAQARLTVFYVDLGICALFLAEFLWSWSRSGRGWQFLFRNWYDVLGMIPVAHPTFTDDGGWSMVLWLVVVLARIGRAADRLVGERVTAALTLRATSALVSVVRQPLTVAVLDDVADVLETGHYTRNFATALAENQDKLKLMIREKLEEDRLTGRVSLVPFHESLIDTVSETTLRVVFAILADPRTDELIADLLRENIDQMRAEINSKAYGKARGTAAIRAADDIPEREDIPGLHSRGTQL